MGLFSRLNTQPELRLVVNLVQVICYVIFQVGNSTFNLSVFFFTFLYQLQGQAWPEATEKPNSTFVLVDQFH